MNENENLEQDLDENFEEERKKGLEEFLDNLNEDYEKIDDDIDFSEIDATNVGFQPLKEQQKDINQEINEQNTDEEEPKEDKHKNPIVGIEILGKGVIGIELYPKIAPNTVNNFIYLIKRGFYNGLTFHRVIKGFVIQGGCPKGNGSGGPGYCIDGEFKSNGFEQNNLKHTRGVISMARAKDPDSAGSQFFIVHESTEHLNGLYAGFGKVISGMRLVDEIANCLTNKYDKPREEQIIKRIVVETFGVEYPDPIQNNNKAF